MSNINSISPIVSRLKRYLDEENSELTISILCYELCLDYDELGEYEKAFTFASEAINIISKKYGTTSKLYGELVQNVAYIFIKKGYYRYYDSLDAWVGCVQGSENAYLYSILTVNYKNAFDVTQDVHYLDFAIEAATNACNLMDRSKESNIQTLGKLYAYRYIKNHNKQDYDKVILYLKNGEEFIRMLEKFVTKMQ